MFIYLFPHANEYIFFFIYNQYYLHNKLKLIIKNFDLIRIIKEEQDILNNIEKNRLKLKQLEKNITVILMKFLQNI